MKKIIKLIFLIILVQGMLSCLPSREARVEKAARLLKEYLYEKYGEEFNIGYIGLRGDERSQFYQTDILPVRLIGTGKEFDQYYWGKGYVRVRGTTLTPGSDYDTVIMKENANEFFRPKLEEIFGNNFISAIEIDITYGTTDFQAGLKERGKSPVRGSIFIFGKVENNADREEYRQKIFEFITYLKEIGCFEYTAMWIAVVDERVLSDDFASNSDDKLRLNGLYEEKGKNYMRSIEKIVHEFTADFDTNPESIQLLWQLYKESGEEYIRERSEIMSKYTESFSNTSEENKQKIIKGYGKSGIVGKTNYNYLLVTPVFSPKHILDVKSKTKRITNYEEINNVHFTEEIYYRGDINE